LYKGKTICVVIPVYNEENIIGDLVTGIKETMKDKAEIIVVDDGSSDGTAKKAEDAGAVVIRHPYNKGNGAAIKTGIRKAKGDIVVLMDGDGQHNPEDIPKLLESMNDYDMVVGARSGKSETSFHRNIANKIYNLFATYLTHVKIMDLTSGLRAVKRDVAMKFLYLFPNTFSYPTTSTLALIKAGYSVKYVPIKTYKRSGKSKISLFKDGVRFILIMLKIATLFSPFRVFFPISLVIFFTGLVYSLYMLTFRHRFTNMSMLLLVTGVLVFLMGLIAEQVALLRMERSEE